VRSYLALSTTPGKASDPRPEPLEQPCEPIGLDPMRRVEMVAVLEDLDLEVGEDAAEPLADLIEGVDDIVPPVACSTRGRI
jgi:hypothetical protein